MKSSVYNMIFPTPYWHCTREGPYGLNSSWPSAILRHSIPPLSIRLFGEITGFADNFNLALTFSMAIKLMFATTV